MQSASVVIPSLNRVATLVEVLRSLSRQSFPMDRLEVIVADDGSTDGTRERLRRLKLPFRLIYRRLERSDGIRSGICRPRNAGLRAATGDVIILLDADVLASPQLVSEHVQAHAASARPQAVVGYTFGYGPPLMRTPEELQPPPPSRLLRELPRIMRSPRGFKWLDCRDWVYERWPKLAGCAAPFGYFWGHNVSFPRELALEVGGFDEDFVGWGVEDVEFAYRLHKAGAEFSHEAEAWGVHCPHPIRDYSEEFIRNMRYFVGKHAEPLAECWSWWFLSLTGNLRRSQSTSRVDHFEAGDELAALVRKPPRLPKPESKQVRSLFGALDGARGKRIWFGPELAASFTEQGIVCSHPFGSVRKASTPSLLGLFTPWPDKSFSTAVAADYWRGLSPYLLGELLHELSRIASKVVLVQSGASRGHRGLRVWTTDDVRAAAIGRARVTRMTRPPWTAFVVRSG